MKEPEVGSGGHTASGVCWAPRCDLGVSFHSTGCLGLSPQGGPSQPFGLVTNGDAFLGLTDDPTQTPGGSTFWGTSNVTTEAAFYERKNKLKK